MRGKGSAEFSRKPLSADDILAAGFYRPEKTLGHEVLHEPPPAPVSKTKKEKPTHYKIVCISLYQNDIDRLETLVERLKSRGHTKANKSQVIRAALAQIDLDKVPRSR